MWFLEEPRGNEVQTHVQFFTVKLFLMSQVELTLSPVLPTPLLLQLSEHI